MTVRVSLKTAQKLKGQRLKYAYNAMDCIGTRQIFDVISENLDPATQRTYDMERSTQRGAFAMSMRGILIDQTKRDARVRELTKQLRAFERSINDDPLVQEKWDGLEKETGKCPKSTRKDGKHTWEAGKEDTPDRHCTSCGCSRFKRAAFNPNSPDQVAHLFYDILGAKKQYNKKHEVSVDEECLARIGKQKKAFLPLTDKIREVKDRKKQIGFLNAKLRNGRYASSFNVGAAVTGRWSSNKDIFRLGGNVQNIAEQNRDIFIADPGKWLFYADLKQAESKTIAHISGDENYIKAHEGDTHTFVCHMLWQEGLNGVAWPPDPKGWKSFATSNFPAWDNVVGHDFRFQSKSVQHGSNLGLTAFGLAMQKHIPLKAAQDGQMRYFRNFPGIRLWQNWVRAKVQGMEPISDPLGVETRLYGRPWDEHTYKQGLAIQPQGTVAHVINLAIDNIFNELEPEKVWLLAQVHDAILGEVDEGDFETLERVKELMSIPIPVTDIHGQERVMIIEPEIAAGKNWGHFDPKHPEKNPDGIRDPAFLKGGIECQKPAQEKNSVKRSRLMKKPSGTSRKPPTLSASRSRRLSGGIRGRSSKG